MTWELIHWNYPFNFGLRFLLLARSRGHWASPLAPLGFSAISGELSPRQIALCNPHLRVTLGMGRYRNPNPIWGQLCKINTFCKLWNGKTFLWLVSPSCTNHWTWSRKEMGFHWRAPWTWGSADWGCVPQVWLASLGNWGILFFSVSCPVKITWKEPLGFTFRLSKKTTWRKCSSQTVCACALIKQYQFILRLSLNLLLHSTDIFMVGVITCRCCS